MIINRNSKKIVIKKPLKQQILAILVCLVFSIFGILMILNVGINWFSVLTTGFFGLGLVVLVFYFLKSHSSIIFDTKGVEVSLSNKSKTKIPWKEIKKIGIQITGVVMGANAIDSDFLVLSFYEPTKYKFEFKWPDSTILASSKTFETYIGDFKGDFYISLSYLDMDEKKIQKLVNEFQQKFSVKLEKFPYLLKTNDKALYEATVAHMKEMEKGN